MQDKFELTGGESDGSGNRLPYVNVPMHLTPLFIFAFVGHEAHVAYLHTRHIQGTQTHSCFLCWVQCMCSISMSTAGRQVVKGAP
jgi:hypothetical protein